MALTRARGKFICLANVDYMNHRNLSKDLMFKKMINEQMKNYNKVTNTYFKDLNKEALGNIKKKGFHLKVRLPHLQLMDLWRQSR